MTLHPVSAWHDEVGSRVRDSAFETTHVDTLQPEAFWQSPLETSLKAFDVLARRVAEAPPIDRCFALLVISLEPSVRMDRRVPASVRPTDLRQSPPSLYVCGPNLWSSWTDDEEYRVPATPGWFSLSHGRVHFRVHRSPEAARRGWEWERSFYVHSERS